MGSSSDKGKKYIPQKKLDNQPDYINLKSVKKINLQMEKSVCKIYCNEGTGTGFFCKIPFPDQYNLLSVLITNNHVINEINITKMDKIKISLNDDKIHYILNINDSIKTYTSKKFDITIIEINQKEIDLSNEFFLELDDSLYNCNNINIYKNN